MSFKFLNVTVAATLVLLTFTSGHKDEQIHQRFIAGNSNQLCFKCDDASVNPEEGCAHTTVYPRLSPMSCHDYCIAHITVTQTGRVLTKRGCGTQNQCIQGFAHTLTKPACFSTNKGQHPGLSCTFCCKTPDDPFARPTYCLGPADSHYDNFTGSLTPVGTWKPWGGWGACSVTCDTGSRERTRSCDTSRGLQCQGSSRETEVCHIAVPCPHWGPYHEIGACSVTCGQGAVEVERTCSTGNNNDCAGSQYGEKPCDPVSVAIVLFAVTFGFESAYTHKRFIVIKGLQECCLCDDTSDTQPDCSDTNCRSSADLCPNYCKAEISVTQSGHVLMKRSCGSVEECVQGFGNTLNKPACFVPSKGQHPGLSCTFCCKKPDNPFTSPMYCIGRPTSNYDNLTGLIMSTTTPTTSTSTSTSATTSMTVAPVDTWKPWEDWGACSATCGTGSRERTRSCDTSRAMACLGTFKETRHCNTMPCPYWGPYQETSSCSVTCGQGHVEIKRECSTGNNKDCAGSPYDERPCKLRDCDMTPIVPTTHPATGPTSGTKHATCHVCVGDGCQPNVKACSLNEPYCMNIVSLESGKTKVLKKECASYAECYYDAYIHNEQRCDVGTTSSAASSNAILCRYCCQTNDFSTPCNTATIPSTLLQYRSLTGTLLPQTTGSTLPATITSSATSQPVTTQVHP